MDNKKPRRNSTVFVEDSNQQHKSKKEIISTIVGYKYKIIRSKLAEIYCSPIKSNKLAK